MDNFKNKVILASKWSVLTEMVSRAISPFIFVVLARLLTPEDYGVVAAAAIVIGFSRIFSDAGLGSTLIQSREDKDKVANIVFWGNTGISILVYTIIFFSSKFIANTFHDARIEDVLKVQSLLIIFNSLSATHAALLKKELDFRKLFWVRLLTVGMPGLASIPLAYFGYGYWALVSGTLSGAVFQMIILWKLSKWRPTFVIDFPLLKKTFGFSGFVTVESLLGWFYNWGDSAIVGAYLSTKDLGLFRTGNSFVVMIFGLLLSPLLPVLYSTFSLLNNEPKKLFDYFSRANKIIGFIALPTVALILLYRNQTEILIFGSKWVGVSEVIGFMVLMYGLSWLVGANYDLYRAIGRPKINIIIMSSSLPFYVFVYFITVQKGLTAFLIGRLLLATIMLPIHALLSYKLIHYNYLNLFKELKSILTIIILASVFNYSIIWFIPSFNDSILFATFGILFIISTIIIVENKFVKNILILLTKNKK